MQRLDSAVPGRGVSFIVLKRPISGRCATAVESKSSEVRMPAGALCVSGSPLPRQRGDGAVPQALRRWWIRVSAAQGRSPPGDCAVTSAVGDLWGAV